MPAAKPEDPSLILRTHTAEGRELTLLLSSDLHRGTMVQKHTQISKIVGLKKKLFPLSPLHYFFRN